MGDRKFTFIELHLDGDHQFGPRTIDDALPFGKKREAPERETEVDSDTDDEAAAADDGSGGKAIGAIVALVALVGIAVAARKFSGDDEDDPLEEDEQPDVIVN